MHPKPCIGDNVHHENPVHRCLSEYPVQDPGENPSVRTMLGEMWSLWISNSALCIFQGTCRETGWASGCWHPTISGARPLQSVSDAHPLD